MGYVFGIDAGGSSTICAVADTEGKLVSFGQSGAANYKLVGVDASQKHIQEAIQIAQVRAGIGRADLAYGFYAVSGLDTDEDYNIIDRFIREITPTERYGLDNDAIASLILGSSRGCGVVIICGTGSNCIAVNEEGRRLQVGGLGREFGDFAGGREIALQAMAAAQRGFDGRGPATLLYDRIINYLGVESLADFSPILHYSARAYPIANLVPLVFSAAKREMRWPAHPQVQRRGAGPVRGGGHQQTVWAGQTRGSGAHRRGFSPRQGAPSYRHALRQIEGEVPSGGLFYSPGRTGCWKCDPGPARCGSRCLSPDAGGNGAADECLYGPG